MDKYFYPNVKGSYEEKSESDFETSSEKIISDEKNEFTEEEMGIIKFCLGHYAETGMEDLKEYKPEYWKKVEALYKKIFGRDMLDLEASFKK